MAKPVVKVETVKFKFNGVWVDLHVCSGARAADKAVRASDLLKQALESRNPQQRTAILAWKLLAHNLRLCQRHMERKGDQFKAYALCVFALAVVDEAASYYAPVAESAAGYYLLAIWEKFKTDFYHYTKQLLVRFFFP